MKETFELVLQIIISLGGLAGLVLLIAMTVLTISSNAAEQARNRRQEARDKAYHEERMKSLRRAR